MTRRRTRTAFTTDWWGRWLSPGRAVRRVAAAGGDLIHGKIVGIDADWALPKNRRGRRRTKTRTVRRRG